MNNDLISIIIPVFNSEKTIAKCIDSVIDQTYKNIELIIINDGSTDKTLDILKKYKKTYNKLKLIAQKNSGVSSARNVGIKNSKGAYIIFIDSDDFVSKNLVSNMYRKIKDTSSTTAVCGYRFMTNKRSIDYNAVFNIITSKDDFDKKLKKMISSRMILSPFSKMYNTKIIFDNKITFNENISNGEDLLFNLDYFSLTQKIVASNSVDYYYDVSTPASLSKTLNNHRIDANVLIYDRSKKFIKDLNLRSKNIKFFAKYYIKAMSLCTDIILEDQKISKANKNILIKKIADLNTTTEVLKRLSNTPSAIAYYIFWTTKSVSAIRIFSYFRILAKKALR